MQKLILLFILFLAGKASFSQQQYFVYIQSENKQPFYVLLNGKTYSSSEYGHVILSKLADSTHHISIGFPKKAFPEQIFTIPINRKDAGYQLKNLGEKGWALFNFQTLNLVMSASTASLEKKSPNFSGVKKTDGFSVLLATVVNDSSILYNATVAQQKQIEEKPIAVAEQKRDSLATVPPVSDTSQKKAIVSTTTASTSAPVQKPAANEAATKSVSPTAAAPSVIVPATAPVKEEPAKKQPEVVAKADSNLNKKDEVIKLKETNTGNSLNITFLSRNDLQTDTIEISIPIEKTEEKPGVAAAGLPAKDSLEKKTTAQNNVPATTAAVAANSDTGPAKKTAKPAPINNCKNYATDGDVDKLRVKILAVKTNAEKIDAAKKVYKTKCFSVRQIKALSELFKTDEGRFSLFEASYSAVSDAYNFKELGNLLTEETYRNRFNEL